MAERVNYRQLYKDANRSGWEFYKNFKEHLKAAKSSPNKSAFYARCAELLLNYNSNLRTYPKYQQKVAYSLISCIPAFGFLAIPALQQFHGIKAKLSFRSKRRKAFSGYRKYFGGRRFKRSFRRGFKRYGRRRFRRSFRRGYRRYGRRRYGRRRY